MSFSLHAKRARDPGEPFGRRVSSVRSCVERYEPLGFTTTLAFLEAQVGPLRRDEATMLASLALLDHSRQVWRREKEEFAVVRRAEKWDGRRTLPNGARNVEYCDRWHADPRAGALFTLDYWHRVQRPLLAADSGDGVVRRFDALVESCLSGEADGDPGFAARLDAVHADLDALAASLAVERAREFRMIRLCKVLRQIDVITGRRDAGAELG